MSEIRLVQTCGACPEQYDAFIGERQVGYLRARWGHFTVTCPDVGGEVIYEQSFGDDGLSGILGDDRDAALATARAAIMAWVERSRDGE